MPISAEQWKTSVGLNNAAHSYALRKHSGKKAPRNFLYQLLLFLVALLSQRAGLITDKFKVGCEVSTPTLSCGPPKSCSRWKGDWFGMLLDVAFYVAVLVSLLYLSGDVETNPGPEYDLVIGNLGKVMTLLLEARGEWHNLGVLLGVPATTLDVIEKDHPDTMARFREMLATWLKQIVPTTCNWEGLVESLKVLGYTQLAHKISASSNWKPKARLSRLDLSEVRSISESTSVVDGSVTHPTSSMRSISESTSVVDGSVTHPTSSNAHPKQEHVPQEHKGTCSKECALYGGRIGTSVSGLVFLVVVTILRVFGLIHS